MKKVKRYIYIQFINSLTHNTETGVLEMNIIGTLSNYDDDDENNCKKQ